MEERESKKIEALIIDDDVDICFLLSLILKNKNIHSVFVNTLAEAIEIFPRYEPAVVFLDNHLPDGLGIDFIPKIRSIYPKSKILIITAHNSENNKRKAEICGAEYFIGKPFNIDEISRVLDLAMNE